MLRKSPSVKLHPAYFKERCASLARLAQDGFETLYVELVFSTTNATI